MTNYVTIKKFCLDTGYSPDAIRSKITRGDWVRGKEYTKAPDGRILINIAEYEKWAENTQASGQQVNLQSRLTSTSRVSAAVNASISSPPPLI